MTVELIIGNCVLCNTPLDKDAGCTNPSCGLYRYREPTTPPNPLYGWVCPRCSVVNAPHVTACRCSGFNATCGDTTNIS